MKNLSVKLLFATVLRANDIESFSRFAIHANSHFESTILIKASIKWPISQNANEEGRLNIS
jgi:hypothetical protein